MHCTIPVGQEIDFVNDVYGLLKLRLIFMVMFAVPVTGVCDTAERRFWARNRSSYW
jgi:hypothetical protein